MVERIRTPRAFLDRLGPSLADHSLSVVLTRERSDPREPVRGEPESAMRRIVPLPTDRVFDVGGTARLSPYAESTVLDLALGRAPELAVTSSGSLPGDLTALPSAALDGDPTTAWTGVFGPQAGQDWIVTTTSGTSFARVDVDFVVDGVHSVPTAARVWVDGVDAGTHPTGLSLNTSPRGTTRRVSFPVEGSDAGTVRIELVEVAERMTRDWYSNSAVAMPVAIAEIGVGISAVVTGTEIDTGCVAGVLDVDGHDVAVRIQGSVAQALRGGELLVTSCDRVEVAAGEVQVTAHPADPSSGKRRAFDLDQLVLRSPRDVASPHIFAPVVVDRTGEASYTVEVPAATRDRWLVLGQSFNGGWHAFVDGSDIGEQVLLDGFANAWLLPAGEALTVELEWTPQRLVDRMLLLSFVGILLCLVVAWRGRRHVPPKPASRADGSAQPTLGRLPGSTPATRRATPQLAAGATITVLGLSLVILPTALWLAVPLAILTAILVRLAKPAGVAVLLASGLFGVTALLIMIEQRRFRNPPDFGWAQQYDDLHILGMLTIMLIAVEYVRAVVRPAP